MSAESRGVAVVSGGGSGLGRAIALELARLPRQQVGAGRPGGGAAGGAAWERRAHQCALPRRHRHADLGPPPRRVEPRRHGEPPRGGAGPGIHPRRRPLDARRGGPSRAGRGSPVSWLLPLTLLLPLLAVVPGGAWALPLIAPLTLWLAFRERVRAQDYLGAWTLGMAWAVLLSAGVILTVLWWPEAARGGVLHREAYRQEMFG